MKVDNKYDVVCFGEVLWDVLPSGAVPGGAPMNVAYHLHKQNKRPALITRVGDDERGKELVHIFSEFGVTTGFFQKDREHETGIVYAKPNEKGDVVYDIVKPVAWDFIEWNQQLNDLVASCDYFVFGSLASRNEVSKETLFQLQEVAKFKVLDINLRPPHYNRQIVEELLSKCDLLKLNLEELELISSWYSHFNLLEGRIRSIAEKFKIKNIAVTKGSEGATLLIGGKIHHHPGFKVSVEDTVGSGDAFLAGLISKLSSGVSPEQTLEYACRLGSFIATQRGACPEYDVKQVEELRT